MFTFQKVRRVLECCQLFEPCDRCNGIRVSDRDLPTLSWGAGEHSAYQREMRPVMAQRSLFGSESQLREHIFPAFRRVAADGRKTRTQVRCLYANSQPPQVFRGDRDRTWRQLSVVVSKTKTFIYPRQTATDF